MLERNLQDRIRLFLSESRLATMFRNNVGFDKVRKVHYGMHRGSADLIGWTTKTITSNMVGNHVAVFTAIEIKVGKRKASEAQLNFIDQVLKSGGIAGVARNKSDAERLLR